MPGDFRVTVTNEYTYGAYGELLTAPTFYGESDSRRSGYVYEEIPDGVLALAQEYFEPPTRPEGVML